MRCIDRLSLDNKRKLFDRLLDKLLEAIREGDFVIHMGYYDRLVRIASYVGKRVVTESLH